MRAFAYFAALAALPVLFATPVRAVELAQAGAPAAAARIGVAAAVVGQVRLDAIPGVRDVGVDVASGTPIFLGDAVSTGPGGRLQIMLLDETVFTIGPDAAMKIDKFVYDPGTGAGTVNASIAKGAFRFVSGQVAKRNPSDMEVRVPTGTIGIRGTSVAGVVDGLRATIVLLGPGAETDTGERVGRILVTAANTTVEVSRPGFAVDLAGVNVPPTAPFRVDAATVNRIVAPLSGPPRAAQAQGQPGGPPGAPPPGQQGQAAQPGQQGPQGSGQGARQPMGDGPAPRNQAGAGLAGGLQGLRTVAGLAPQQSAAQGLVAGAPPPLASFAAGQTVTFEQLRAISTGKAEFGPQSIQMTQTAGAAQAAVYVFRFNYDFGSRTTYNSQVSINLAAGGSLNGGGSIVTGTFPLLASPFGSGTGLAKIQEANITVPTIGGQATVRYELVSGTGALLAQVRHDVRYQNGAVVLVGQGAAPRK
ncbi:MAG: FecR domain-containing protein [Tagaea sp.]